MGRKFPLQIDSSAVFSKILQSCAREGYLRGIQRVHGLLLQTEFSSETFILNRLVDSYARCGSTDEAKKVFDGVPRKNVFSCNAMISAYSRDGRIEEASKMFDEMPERDQCSWNSMISGLSQHGFLEDALMFFSGMHGDDFALNTYSFSSALSACAGLQDLSAGIQIHGAISKSPVKGDVFMGSALVDMYAKCGRPLEARKMFDEMPERNVVSWNSLITCYEQNGPACEALQLFERMMVSGVEPDEVTLASVVSACATLIALKEGAQIHARTVKSDKLRSDLVLCNALVDMYTKCGRLNFARQVFDGMPLRNIVSQTSLLSGYARCASVEAAKFLFLQMSDKNIVAWNALIAGYVQSGQSVEALNLFRQLKAAAFWPTHYTLGNTLSACADLANLRLGQQAHAQAMKHGSIFSRSDREPAIFVSNSLIDLYFKCGAPDEAMKVFLRMPAHDRVSWNAVIVGLAQNGSADQALQTFDQMTAAGETPDHVTMIGVLTACSHAGLVEAGLSHFKALTEQHRVTASCDHYTCMVDLLARAGRLREAAEMAETMPVSADSALWGSMLAACRVHGHVEVGEWVSRRLMEMDKENSAPYVLLSNMYAEAGRWADAKRLRKMMTGRGVEKQPGCSWIDVEGNTHVFLAKDRAHPQRKEIYGVVKYLWSHMNRSVNFLST